MAPSIQPVILGEALVLHNKPTARGPILGPTMQNGPPEIMRARAHRESVEKRGKLQLHCDEVPYSREKASLERILDNHREGSEDADLDHKLLVHNRAKGRIVIGISRVALDTTEGKVQAAPQESVHHNHNHHCVEIITDRRVKNGQHPEEIEPVAETVNVSTQDLFSIATCDFSLEHRDLI
ncbi:peptidyl-glycine alpha-amidating monooxygenase [Striga asiatica]|uniref:Peptidyl-glycine alpha-amidating monooxygenase n=1 Tax=Striga asiatica TaxID=4170 RepID=A0A5A7NYT3_STRAF|nr:peptidyl-glycine alpha-amidating monooxygenase [Striga asiatica]